MIYQSKLSVNSPQNRSHCYYIIQQIRFSILLSIFFKIKACETYRLQEKQLKNCVYVGALDSKLLLDFPKNSEIKSSSLIGIKTIL